MPFSIPLSLAIYFVIWFTVLFAVLPFGVTSQHEAGDVMKGADPGRARRAAAARQGVVDHGDFGGDLRRRRRLRSFRRALTPCGRPARVPALLTRAGG